MSGLADGMLSMREFKTGATRDAEEGKLDYEGFLSPAVEERYAEYMHTHRKQTDGKLRAADNWQKGIPEDVYMKSMFRHFMDVWKGHRGLPAPDLEESLCALKFNVNGMLFERLRNRTSNGHKTISDGFGSTWSAICPTCGGETMQVVRPGKVQCYECG